MNENPRVLLPWTRRSFVGVGMGAAVLAAGACRGQGQPPSGPGTDGSQPAPTASEAWREGGWFVHGNVDTSFLDHGIIRARLGGQWRDLVLGDLPDRFMEWSLSRRLAKMKDLAEKGFDPEDLDGPHNACVATFGGPTRGSFTSLNTAYKGMGFIPRPERLADALGDLKDFANRMQGSGLGMSQALAHTTRYLSSLYESPDLFDRQRQVSL